MAIEKRSATCWRISWMQKKEDGTWTTYRRNIRLPAGTSDDAARAYCAVELNRLKDDIANDAVLDPARPYTISELYHTWMHKHVEINLQPKTQTVYENIITRHVLPSLGEVKLQDLTPATLTNWISYIQSQGKTEAGKPYAVRTLQHIYDCLDNLLKKAVQWELLEKNPMEKVERPKGRKPRAKALTEEQALDVLDALAGEKPAFVLAVMLAIFCGCRLGETVGLKLSDVDFRAGTIDITRAVKYTPRTGTYIDAQKTEASARVVHLPASLIRVLEDEKRSQREALEAVGSAYCSEGWLIHGDLGDRLALEWPSKAWRKFADSHGYKGYTYHMLRHTCATILIANNVDIVAVAYHMGHSDPSTTLRIYAHQIPRREKDAARVFDSLADSRRESP